MSTFQFPSSTPPSTPPRSSSRINIPSTTPAGPPPTVNTTASFTPAGAPPPSVFGSSQFGTARSARVPAFSGFGRGTSSNPSTGISDRGRNEGFDQKKSIGMTFAAPDSSPPALSDGEESYAEEDEDMEEDADHTMADVTMASAAFGRTSPLASGTGLFRGTSRSPLKRMRVEDERSADVDIVGLRQDLNGVAKGLAAAADGPAPLEESDNVILETDAITSQLAHVEVGDEEEILSEIARELREVWEGKDYVGSRQEGHIGPTEDSGYARASFVASLMLQLYHPISNVPPQRNSSRLGRRPQQFTPMPRILLDWMDQHHDPLSKVLVDETTAYTEGYSAAPDFWNTVFSLLLHGRFEQTISLLQGANFRVAATAEADGFDDGYVGKALMHIDKVVHQATNILKSCPALTNNEWDMTSLQWSKYRREIQKAIADLKQFAEGIAEPDDEDDLAAAARTFKPNARSSNYNLTNSIRRAESKVPWSVYENLQNMYNHLLGSTDDIIASSFDWLEATIGLTVWWDGAEESDFQAKGSLAASRRSLHQGLGRREVDVTPAIAYRKKLAENLRFVTMARKDDDMEVEETSELQVNTTDAVEVSLACSLTGNVEGVISLLETMSLPVASAVVEIASTGGWISGTRSDKDILRGFDKSDLLVLGFSSESQEEQSSRKDDLLTVYAEALAGRDALKRGDGKRVVEGWELAVGLLSRLDDEEAADLRIGELLERLPLISAERVNKVVSLCQDLGMDKHGIETAERYASRLEQTTKSYGEALLYYARAHNASKIRDVLDILTSLSLVQSIAFPSISDLDPILARFITSPKQSLTELSRTDVEAATMLSTYLSGYATLRRFYELRDEEINLKDGQKPSFRPLARTKAAANALITVIQSAGTSIQGGLYDPEVDVVVQVDGLTVLLGEALVFLDRPRAVFTTPQLFQLLKAVEDLQTVGSLVYTQCEEVLASALENFHNKTTPSAESILKRSTRAKTNLDKSTSNLTASSQFSLVGSSLLSEQAEANEGVKRAWDWRSGLRKGGTGEDVLRILRLAVAKEISKNWANGET